MKGRVKWFDVAKGYGFIGPEDGPDVFVRRRAIQGYRELNQGEEVEFEIEETRKGPEAVRVRPLRERRAS